MSRNDPKLGDGMCPVCKIVPAVKRYGYCSGCHSRLTGEYAKRRNPQYAENRKIGTWRRDPTKRKPPADWRELLRKAEEEK